MWVKKDVGGSGKNRFVWLDREVSLTLKVYSTCVFGYRY